jgi:hypothetical protein
MLRLILAALALVCSVAAQSTTVTVAGTLCSGQRAVVTLTRVNSTGGTITTSAQSYTNGAFSAPLISGEDGSRYEATIQCPGTKTAQTWLIPAVAGPLTPTQVSVGPDVRVGPYYWDTVNSIWSTSAAGINTTAGVINGTTIPSNAGTLPTQSDITAAVSGKLAAPTGLSGTPATRFNATTGLLEAVPGVSTDCVKVNGSSGTCGTGGGSGTVVAGTSGKISATTVSSTTTVDTVAGTVAGIVDANTFSGLNKFTMLGLPVVSALVTADCDESTEVGRGVVLTSAATGAKWHVCEQLTSGPATYGWRAQGAGLPACTPAQAIAGAASTCTMTPDVTAAAISASAASDLFGESTFQQTDDFASGSGSTTSIGSLGWSMTTSGTVTTAVYVNGDRNHPGLFRFGVAAATVTGANVLWVGPTTAAPHFSGLQTTGGWEFRFRLRFPTTNQSAFTEAGTQYWIGLASMSGSGAIAASVPIDGFLAHFTTGANGPWSLETLKAGAADAAAQSSTSGNLAAGTWYDIRIRSLAGNDGTVLMSVNAGSGWETEKSFAVTSTASLAPVFMVQTTAATASLPRQIDVDYYKVIESVVRP